jgi:uncharacterized membrane protein
VMLFMKFLHVITAFAFIGGLVGRTVTMWQASKSSDVQMVRTLVHVAGYFERLMVIPGSLAVLGFGLITAWLQRWPLLGALGGSSSNWLLVSTLIYLTMIPMIIFVFVPRGKIFGKALEEAVALGTVTSVLNAAFHDRAVGIAHVYEWLTTIIITFLMVAKPF